MFFRVARKVKYFLNVKVVAKMKSKQKNVA